MCGFFALVPDKSPDLFGAFVFSAPVAFAAIRCSIINAGYLPVSMTIDGAAYVIVCASTQGRLSMSPRVTNLLIFISALAAIAGAWLDGPWLWLHYIGKPLTTMLILWLAFSAQPEVTARYRWAVLVGLVLSLVGDVCLMLPGDRFVPGLVAFLLAHVCYIVAFAPGSGGKARAMAFLVVAAVAMGNLAGLLPRVDAALKVPVLAYVAVLATMAAFALARTWTPAVAQALPGSARLAAIGAVLFMASDSLLAWDRFAGGVPTPALLVLGTYYAAQWCIARSVRRG